MFLALCFAAALIVLAVGLYRRRLWAWRGVWYLLAIDWLLYAATPITRSGAAYPLDWWIVQFIFFGVVWVLPNFLYFKKRRGLFRTAV